MIFSTTIKKGILQFSQEDREDMAKEFNKFDGKTVYVTITGKRPPVSLLQRGYLWGHVYDEISKETGMTPEEINEFCKEKFLTRMWTVEEGREVQLPKSTTRCNTKEMKDFIDQIRAYFAAEYGVETKNPDKSYNVISISPQN